MSVSPLLPAGPLTGDHMHRRIDAHSQLGDLPSTDEKSADRTSLAHDPCGASRLRWLNGLNACRVVRTVIAPGSTERACRHGPGSRCSRGASPRCAIRRGHQRDADSEDPAGEPPTSPSWLYGCAAAPRRLPRDAGAPACPRASVAAPLGKAPLAQGSHNVEGDDRPQPTCSWRGHVAAVRATALQTAPSLTTATRRQLARCADAGPCGRLRLRRREDYRAGAARSRGRGTEGLPAAARPRAATALPGLGLLPSRYCPRLSYSS